MARRTRRCSGETVALERARYASPYGRTTSATSRTGRLMPGAPGGGYPGGSASHGGHAGSHASIGWSSGGSDGRARVGSAGDPPPLRGDVWQRCAGTYLHTTHHSSIVRICYNHHPFFGQTV